MAGWATEVEGVDGATRWMAALRAAPIIVCMDAKFCCCWVR